MTETQNQNLQPRLQEIIATMDVPELRRTDIWWLSRNLTIGNHNHNHPQLAEALNLLKQIRKTQRAAAKPNAALCRDSGNERGAQK